MERLQHYLQAKGESYKWLIGEIIRTATQLHPKIQEMVNQQRKKLKGSIMQLSEQQIKEKINHLQQLKVHHLHNILQLFIISMKNLSVALQTQTSIIKHAPIEVPKQQKNIIKISDFTPIPPTNFTNMIVQPKKSQLIFQKQNQPPSHSLLANSKPNIIQKPSKFTQSKNQNSAKQQRSRFEHYIDNYSPLNISRSRKQPSSFLKLNDMLDNSTSNIKAVTDLDNKIYKQANSLLNTVIRNQSRGSTPQKKQFLNKSPITNLNDSQTD